MDSFKLSKVGESVDDTFESQCQCLLSHQVELSVLDDLWEEEKQ